MSHLTISSSTPPNEVKDPQATNSGKNPGLYTESNKPKGLLEKKWFLLSFFFSSSESVTVKKTTNQEKAAEIGGKYGTAFQKQFLKDFRFKVFFGITVSDREVGSAKQAYAKTLTDLGRTKLDALSDREQKLFPELIKINQQLERLNEQGGSKEAKLSLLNQKGDLLTGVKEQRTTVEALYKKWERLSKMESTDFNYDRANAHKNYYTAKQKLNKLEKEKAEIIERGMGSNTPAASITSNLPIRKGKETNEIEERGEYDIHGHQGVIKQQREEPPDFLEEAFDLEDADRQSNVTEASARSPSNSFDTTTSESTEPSNNKLSRIS